MFKKVKNIISTADNFLFKKFGSNKGTKFLENIKEAQKIFSCLNGDSEEIQTRFVGGCVRRSLTGDSIDDIDLATSFTPDLIKRKLKQIDVKIIDTGISHGTITVIFNDKKFEITTLRKDVSTDGRHADVQFTLNWEQDALRRDFTINAIYADNYGRIFDPLNGRIDLENGKIKFIGIAKERIQEDYLRILRYFRFFMLYSKVDHNKETIQVIKQSINGLNKISNERIFDELKKILSLKNVYSLFKNESSKEIILNIFPQFKYCDRLNKIENLSKGLRNKYTSNLILAILIVDDTDNYEYFCYKYKTSNAIKNRFKNISKNLKNLESKKFYSEENIKKLIYLTSKDEVRDMLLFSVSINEKTIVQDIEKLINYLNVCKIPKFPISGDYLKEHGYKAGEELGKKLKNLEEQWIKNNFIIDKETIKKSLRKSNRN
ncbi:CCA tRNA nucleotidyltransferase [Pelagibacteraceae bacterium]|nr:CCA tRNA nucleotidyltransferase [Pelagibacteraceae bacterium]